MYRIILALISLCCSQKNFCQQVTADHTASKKEVATDTLRHHSVKKAVIQSALLPGLGQVYNRKWWKVPIIYAGFGALGYSIGWNAKRFRTYSDAYRARVDGNSATIDRYTDVYSENNLLVLKNYYKRNMNLAIIFTGVLYALNIIDAAVDAHLFGYDISDDLSLRVEPVMRCHDAAAGNFSGVNVSLRF